MCTYTRSNECRGARAAPVDASILFERRELLCAGGRNGIQMRCQQNALFDFSRRRKAGDKIGAAGRDILKLHGQPRPGSRRGQKVGHSIFTRMGVVCCREGRIDARECNQLAQQFFSSAHRINVATLYGAEIGASRLFRFLTAGPLVNKLTSRQ